MIGRILSSVGAGLVGALALTALSEGLFRFDYAPRMDLIGKRGMKKAFKAAGRKPPRGDKLYYTALGGDLLANGAIFALVGGRHRFLKGAALGTALGTVNVLAPKEAGLGWFPANRSRRTKLMTIGYYLAGGLAAAGADRLFSGSSKPRTSIDEAIAAATV